ncbi:hypothetical protein HY623_03645 [Candidatus Uhrbacteria bacterium]|nr:hypothetical protein [Candidatus Uhrbacteria bacterium]
MEMLVAVSIFSVLVVVSMDVFIRAQRAQREAAALEKVQDVTRFILTRMAQEFHTGHIDYDYYKTALPRTISATAITSDTLALKNSEDTTLLFRKEESGICGTGGATSPCMAMILDPGGTNQSEMVTPDGYTVEKFTVVVTPSADSLTVDPTPTLNDYPFDLQPRITIMMTVKGTVAGLRRPITVPIQTTLSSREYVR